MKWRSLYSLFVLVFVLFCGLMGEMLSGIYAEAAYEVVTVSDFKELKRELETPGKVLIELKGSIAVRDTIYVRGDKEIDGKGYTLSRYQSGKEIFDGTFLTIQEGRFSVRNVTLSGAAKGVQTGKSIYGRLLDIQKGEVTLENGAVLKSNVNTDQNHDGGGAVLVQSGGLLVMNHGEISGNKNVYGGAGVHIERGGGFVMKGGTIQNNQTCGIGNVEGFDGRGGAVYNQGKTTISGGNMCRNRVKGYTSGNISYGGVGGMLYNQGECCIQGGILEGNSASYAGGAIYNDQGSKLRVTGGSICDNEADLGEGLFLAGGSCKLGGTFTLSSVYMAKGTIMTAEESLSIQKHQILVFPESYKKGMCVVKTQGKKAVLKKVFILNSKGNYILISKDDGLYIGEKKKNAKKPLKAVVEKSAGKAEKSPKKGLQKKPKKKIEKRKEGISFQTAPRYLFVWEVVSYTEERWKEELLKGCKIWYGDHKKEEITFRWHWNGLLQNSAGSYQVELSPEGEAGTVIPVTLVQESTEEEKAGYVRFQTPETGNGKTSDEEGYEKEEVWHFDQKDIHDIKGFMTERKDPFSWETNQEFLMRYQKCQISKEG